MFVEVRPSRERLARRERGYRRRLRTLLLVNGRRFPPPLRETRERERDIERVRSVRCEILAGCKYVAAVKIENSGR